MQLTWSREVWIMFKIPIIHIHSDGSLFIECLQNVNIMVPVKLYVPNILTLWAINDSYSSFTTINGQR